MRYYQGSSLYDWGLTLVTVPAGRAGHYAYQNSADTGGIPQLTKDPAGQIMHIANNRDVDPSLRARVVEDGVFSPAWPMVGAPRYNGLAPLWSGSILHVVGMQSQFVNPAHPDLLVASVEWGQSVGLPTQYLTDAAITGKALKANSYWLIPVHYAVGAQTVCGVLRSSDGGLSWTLVGPIALAGAALVEPSIELEDGRVMMVMRREAQGGVLVAGSFYQTWLWPDGQQIAGAGIVPIAPATTRIGGSPGCLGKGSDGAILLLFGTGMVAGDNYWEVWRWTGTTLVYSSKVGSTEPASGPAYRYIAFKDGWLVAGEPDLPNNSAQQCRLKTTPFDAVQLFVDRACPITWPSASEIVWDMDLTRMDPGGRNGYVLFLLGTATANMVGWRFADGMVMPWYMGDSWPTGYTMWIGIEKRLRIKIKASSVEWWINDYLAKTMAPSSLPTPPTQIAAIIPDASVWQISRQSIRT